jgi:uncharacterized membrane-anchored protein
MKKLLIFILLLAYLVGIAHADISPVPMMLLAGLTFLAFIVVLLTAFAITLVVELITSYLYRHFKKLSKRILLGVILANIISFPLFWIFVVLASSYVPYWILVIAGEVVVFVLEAAVIFLPNKKRMKLIDAVAISLINNLASFLVGVGLFLLLRVAL